jgi:hypothetical protein
MNSISQTIQEINFSKEASRKILAKLCKVLGPVSWELMYLEWCNNNNNNNNNKNNNNFPYI